MFVPLIYMYIYGILNHMSRGLTSISDWFPADLIIAHKRTMIYSLRKTEFNDNYLINMWSGCSSVDCTCCLAPWLAGIKRYIVLRLKEESKDQYMMLWWSNILAIGDWVGVGVGGGGKGSWWGWYQTTWAILWLHSYIPQNSQIYC